MLCKDFLKLIGCLDPEKFEIFFPDDLVWLEELSIEVFEASPWCISLHYQYGCLVFTENHTLHQLPADFNELFQEEKNSIADPIEMYSAE